MVCGASRIEVAALAVVAALALVGATLAGGVEGPLGFGHWLLLAVISVSTLAAMARAVMHRPRPGSVLGMLAVATLFFALANAILVIPLGLVPSWLALASTGFDVLLLGVAVALWDAFDEGQALRADMLRSFVGTVLVAALFGGQALIGVAVTRDQGRTVVTVLVFSSLAVAIAINVLADPLAGVLDRLVFSRSPALRADRAARPISRSSGPTNSRRCWPTGSRPSNPATEPTSAPPNSGATTTRCTSRTSSGCAPTRRTPPRRGWTRWPGRRGSGSSPRCRSGRCTTGRTRRPG